MEVNTQRRAVGLRDKIPDIKKTLDMVRFLKIRKEVCRLPCPALSSLRLGFVNMVVCARTLITGWPQSNSSSDIDTSFELNDTLYARASISPSDMEEVYLWLGANVMLAYPVEEAEEMLQEKLSAAEKSLANCEEDLEFLREQVTVGSPLPPDGTALSFYAWLADMVEQTLEVATARVYNWDVVQRRKEKAEGKGDDEEDGNAQKKKPDG